MDKQYYSTTEVANLLNETDSTIRFWCKEFEYFLHIERQSTHRRFKEQDITKLKYIKKLLKENRYTIIQTFNHLKENNFKKENYKDKEDVLIEKIVSEVSLMFKENLNNTKNEILEYLDKSIDNMNKQLLENQNENSNKLLDSVSKTINKQLDDKLEQLKVYQQLKMEQQKNKQLENIILELHNSILDKNNVKSNKKGIFGICK